MFSFTCSAAQNQDQNQNACQLPPVCQDAHTVLDQCTGNTTACAANEQCVNSQCVANSCLATYSCQDAHTIVNSCTGATTACNAGEKCVNGACVADVCTPVYTCSGSSVINSCTGGVSRVCSAPTICSGGACIIPAPSGTFTVQPTLVSSGGVATLTWSMQNVVANSRRISGTNGDRWYNQPTSDSAGRTSSPITAATTFSLTCTGVDGTSITLTRQVSLLPRYQER